MSLPVSMTREDRCREASVPFYLLFSNPGVKVLKTNAIELLPTSGIL